ncbi:MAG TPA: hypothetical protein DIW47_00200 [Bacteroidetes bacterium]|nr:hypothetical protein [Bacteroidota bacterium]
MRKLLLILPVLLLLSHGCVRTCDCFDECTDIITYKFDTSAGSFHAAETDSFYVQIQLENDSHWYTDSIGSSSPLKYHLLFDSIWIGPSCGPLNSPGFGLGAEVIEQDTRKEKNIKSLRVITASDTATLDSLIMTIHKRGRINCKCVSYVEFSFYQKGVKTYLIAKEPSPYISVTLIPD